MVKNSFQEDYPESLRNCYGCGTNNPHGLHINSYWDGDESIATFQPRKYHMAAYPEFVYGGLIASIFDCHCVGTAAAAAYREEGRESGTLPAYRYVTGSLHVDYLKPTPLGPLIMIRARVEEIKGRKTVVEATISTDGVVTAKARVIAIRMSDNLMQSAKQ